MAAQTRDLPTIVLVQGSLQIPEVYAKLVQGLVARGYPTLSLVDDALAIRAELIRQLEHEGKTVVVVMHSYGGFVGSEATTEELSYAKRQAQGLPGGVIHLFLYTAFLLNEGQSVLSAFGKSPNDDVHPDGRYYVLHGEHTLYNDLPSPEASLWASRLIAQSYLVQTTKLTRAAWRYIPSTYLICENDQASPPTYQEMFAAKAKAHVEKCSSGHSPHLSQPEMLVQKIHEASQKAVAGLAKEDVDSEI